MSQFPTYNFNDPDLDYAPVYITVQNMFSHLLQKHCGCPNVKNERLLCKVDGLMQAVEIDATNNEDRYKQGVEASYKLLFNLV